MKAFPHSLTLTSEQINLLITALHHYGNDLNDVNRYRQVVSSSKYCAEGLYADIQFDSNLIDLEPIEYSEKTIEPTEDYLYGLLKASKNQSHTQNEVLS